MATVIFPFGNARLWTNKAKMTAQAPSPESGTNVDGMWSFGILLYYAFRAR